MSRRVNTRPLEPVSPAWLTRAEASVYTGQSQATIRRASKKTSTDEFPPPLYGTKRQGVHDNAPTFHHRDDLDDWMRRFPDG